MTDWNQFLVDKGAVQDMNGHPGFPVPEISSDHTYVIPLDQGLIEVKGPDSAKFLQGQVTCDVRELATQATHQTTRLGAQCNLKGRMLLCFRALQPAADRILLRVHSGLINKGLASLGKYIVFSKATLADVSKSYNSVGIAGPMAGQIVKTLFRVELRGNEEWQADGEHLIIRISENRYECWLDAKTAKTVWEHICTKATPANQHLWTLLDIQAGIGGITPETYEIFTPQAINFQLVNGINFRKGCYTGQEIVARLHYRGTLKRHMYRFGFSLFDQGLPQPGTELKNAEGKNVGEIILAAPVGMSGGELLASVVDDERVDIYLPNNPQKLSLLSLPYAIPTPNEAE